MPCYHPEFHTYKHVYKHTYKNVCLNANNIRGEKVTHTGTAMWREVPPPHILLTPWQAARPLTQSPHLCGEVAGPDTICNHRHRCSPVHTCRHTGSPMQREYRYEDLGRHTCPQGWPHVPTAVWLQRRSPRNRGSQMHLETRAANTQLDTHRHADTHPQDKRGHTRTHIWALTLLLSPFSWPSSMRRSSWKRKTM